jgi:A/G-specific adenine glycosylase
VTTAPAVAGSRLVEPVIDWYAGAARDLPWRHPDVTPWGVLVSEFMLQQTPVARVLEPYAAWMRRWPTPAALAVASPGAAIGAWGRLGYPRRARWLHAAARRIVSEHGGEVPRSYQALRALPGVGDYTATAVLSFAYGERWAVLDTNVRRVLGRAVRGRAYPPPAVTAAERAIAQDLLPADGDSAARWAAAAMELGATICTARAPGCERCPVAHICAWHGAGRPLDASTARRRVQAWQGTDRQARGALLAVVRDSPVPVSAESLAAAWTAAEQRERALKGLIADGLVEVVRAGSAAEAARYRLPTT